MFAKDAWGQGYATEALEAMVDVARRINVDESTRSVIPSTGLIRNIIVSRSPAARPRLNTLFTRLPGSASCGKSSKAAVHFFNTRITRGDIRSACNEQVNRALVWKTLWNYTDLNWNCGSGTGV